MKPFFSAGIPNPRHELNFESASPGDSFVLSLALIMYQYLFSWPFYSGAIGVEVDFIDI